ncbi:MAG TPA: HEAT repeat domain-containing protein [Sphaerochaeta sp.]|nr:HEAT repeat domain-containing protein [Sphaerochaeta sp.]
MPKTKYLSDKEKRIGQKHMYRQEVFNGISFSLMGETVVYLLALYFGAGNFALGYISSVIFLAGIILPVVPRMLKGKHHTRTQSFVWHFRGLVGLGYLGLFIVSGDWAVFLLLTVYTLYNLVRMIGIALNDSTMKSISSPSNRGKVVANANVAYQSSSMTVRLIMTAVFAVQRFSGLVGLVTMQLLGVVANCFASREIKKIPSRMVITHKPGRTVWTLFTEAMAQPVLRRRLLLKWLATGVTVIFGLTTPFFRIELGSSNGIVVLYSVLLGLSVMVASWVSKRFSDRLGSKPLVVISTLFTLGFFALWAILPRTLHFAWFFGLGFLTNTFVALINLLTFRLLTQVMPDDELVSFNSMVNFINGIVAFGVGMLSGFLANFTQGSLLFHGTALGNGYTLVFIFGFALILVEALVALRIQEIGAYSSQAAAQVVFSMHGIRAVSMIERLERTSDPAKRRMLMHNLGGNVNYLATSELRSILASPFHVDKLEAVRAIGDRPRKSLLDDLIRVAQDDDSYVQLDAIAALGSYRKEEKAKSALVDLLLHGRWASVRSMASKSLARISDSDEYLNVVNELSRSAKHIDEVIDYLVAKRFMDKEGRFFQEFFIFVEQGRSGTFRQTGYSVVASLLRFGPPSLASLYEERNLSSTKAYLAGFLSEARDLTMIDQNYNLIIQIFAKEQWSKLIDLCLESLRSSDVQADSSLDNLKKGLLKVETMSLESFDVVDMIALLYFTYFICKSQNS